MHFSPMCCCRKKNQLQFSNSSPFLELQWESVDREMAFSRMPDKLSSKVLSLEINNREIFLMYSQLEGERTVRVNGGTDERS